MQEHRVAVCRQRVILAVDIQCCHIYLLGKYDRRKTVSFIGGEPRLVMAPTKKEIKELKEISLISVIVNDMVDIGL
jgi:hypothetical protein